MMKLTLVTEQEVEFVLADGITLQFIRECPGNAMSPRMRILFGDYATGDPSGLHESVCAALTDALEAFDRDKFCIIMEALR